MQTAKNNVKKIKDLSTMEKLYEVAHKTNVSVIIEGPHGIGKSDSVKSFAKRHNAHLETLFLSHQEVADLIGIPHLTEEDGKPVTKWSKPIWLKRLEDAAKEGKKTILFLDELNRAPTDVRQSALQLVLEKQIHEHKLPKTEIDGKVYECFIVAAINPSDDGNYQVDELDPALFDRFLHYELTVDPDRWLEWARENGIHRVVIKYISEHKDRLHRPSENDKIYPTPRSWHKLSDLLFEYEETFGDEGDDATLMALVSGKIGPSIAAQFVNYYKSNSVVTTDDIIKEAKKLYKKYVIDAGIDENVMKEEFDVDNEHYMERAKALSDAIEKAGKELREKYIKDLEVPMIKDLIDNLKDIYLNEKTYKAGSANYYDMIPFIVFLYALPIEILASTIKGIKEQSINSDDSNVSAMFMDFAKQLPAKQLLRKIVDIVYKKEQQED